MSLLPRPDFQKNDLLTSADLNAAQLYQIDLGRKHRAGAHLPGVVDRLGIVQSDTGLRLQDGYAVDEFGRDLVLGSPQPLAPALADAQFDNPGADTFEVLLHYDRKISDGEVINSRLDETPRVEVRALVGVAREQVPYNVVQTAPDDPAFRRPVRLGVLTADPDLAGAWMLRQNAGDRQEAGLVASRIVAARGDDSAISLAKGEFAVVLPSVASSDAVQKTETTGEAAEKDKRLIVTANGAVFRGMLAVEGDIEAGQQLLLPTPGPAPMAGAGCGLFRIGDAQAAPDLHELRLVLPTNGALAIGAWNQQSGKFEAILTVDSATRSVKVAGDLIIEGAVIESHGNDVTGPNAPAAAGQSQEEDKGMLGNLWATLAGYFTSSGKTTMQAVPILVLTVLGLYWDGSAGMLPCDKVNPIRKLFGMTPLLCQGAVSFPGPDPSKMIEATISGDSECTLTTKSKGQKPLTDEEGKPVDTGFKTAIGGFAPLLGALTATGVNPPTSIWIYCKKE